MTAISRRAVLGAAGAAAIAATALPGALRAASSAPALLRVATRTIEVNGRAATVFAIRDAAGRIPAIAGRAGEDWNVRLDNALAEPTALHWHGQTPHWRQDGVPDLTQTAIPPGGSWEYRFPLRAGTHWMHSHLGLQEQALLAAPMIVHAPGDPAADEQEIVLLLHDFSFRPASEILAGLGGGAGGGQGGHGAHGGHAAPAAPSGHAGHGGAATVHANDIEFDAYLANDRTLADPEVVAVERGGRVRLRIINAAAATNFTIDLGSVTGSLIAVDGNPVTPVEGRRFPVAIAQRLDIRLAGLRGGAAIPVLALREDGRERTGLLLAPPGAAVRRLAVLGERKGPRLDLALERRLVATDPPPVPHSLRVHAIALTLSEGPGAYEWGFSVSGGGELARALTVRRGERVEMTFANPTSMAHPMHLHGHHFRVVGIDGARFAGAMRDTVLVPSGGQVTVAFDAGNPGLWALHCHHLYHMVSGMMATLAYEDVG